MKVSSAGAKDVEFVHSIPVLRQIVAPSSSTGGEVVIVILLSRTQAGFTEPAPAKPYCFLL